jgi:hypothetical protein
MLEYNLGPLEFVPSSTVVEYLGIQESLVY